MVLTEYSGQNGTVMTAMMLLSGGAWRRLVAPATTRLSGGEMSTCLSNQLSLLMLLAVHSEVTTRELALSLGITERAVHRILRDLAESGYITIGKRGYRNQYTVHPERSVGHPAFPTLTLGELLAPVIAGSGHNGVANGNGHAEVLLAAAG
jgi:predicted transcriptional regulator